MSSPCSIAKFAFCEQSTESSLVISVTLFDSRRRERSSRRDIYSFRPIAFNTSTILARIVSSAGVGVNFTKILARIITAPAPAVRVCQFCVSHSIQFLLILVGKSSSQLYRLGRKKGKREMNNSLSSSANPNRKCSHTTT